MDLVNVLGIEHYPLFWIGIGCCLLVLEMLGTSGYLLWTGLASILMGIIMAILPFELSMGTQWIIYAFVLVINTYLWWRWLKRKLSLRTNDNLLNERNIQLIGKRGILTEDMIGGIGRGHFADSSWRVKSEVNYPKGTEIVVTEVEGVTLIVEKWNL